MFRGWLLFAADVTCCPLVAGAEKKEIVLYENVLHVCFIYKCEVVLCFHFI